MDKRQRDLLLKTLHKNKTRKNIYKPNLNVIRNKQTVGNTDSDTKNTVQCILPESKRQRSNTEKYKQSEGVFSEGIGQLPKCSLPEHKSVKKLSHLNDHKQESVCLIDENSVSEDSILNELCVCSVEEVADIKSRFEPLELEKKFSKNLHCDSESTFSCRPKHMKERLHTCIKQENLHLPFLKEKIYSTESPGLFVLKLPNPFVYCGSGDQKDSGQLSSVSDGKIGKLSIKRSGKVIVCLGNMKYKLQDITEFFNNNQVVNFNNPESNSDADLPDLIALGETENWYNLIPHQWSSLFGD